MFAVCSEKRPIVYSRSMYIVYMKIAGGLVIASHVTLPEGEGEEWEGGKKGIEIGRRR